jgi:hypothetical protein
MMSSSIGPLRRLSKQHVSFNIGRREAQIDSDDALLCASVNGHREMCWLSSADAPHRRPEWVLTGYSATLKRVERIEVGAGLADALQVGQ